MTDPPINPETFQFPCDYEKKKKVKMLRYNWYKK